MEVHTHSHSSGKKWTHYFWEFIMLFLAVFCGFLAENFREHFTELQREKQYMQSLVKDLQLDTAVLRAGADSKEQRDLSIDSILNYFRNNSTAKEIPTPVLRQMRRSQWDMFFIHHSGTIDQLKNSGGLRLIRKNELVDSIEFYYQQVQRSESRNSMYFDNQQVGYALFEKLVDAADDIKYYQDYMQLQKPFPDSGSLSINRSCLSEYLNFLIQLRIFTGSDRKQFTVALKEAAGRIIDLIKKEYHLK
jgi:hypothetical protein